MFYGKPPIDSSCEILKVQLYEVESLTGRLKFAGEGVWKWWELAHIAGDLLMKLKVQDVRVVSQGITLNAGEILAGVQISDAPIAHKVIAN